MRYRLLCLFILLAGVAQASQSQKATKGAAFLTINPSARAVALGGAFGGVSDDVSAAYYNPAGLSFQKHIEFSAGREARFINLNYDYVLLGVPVLAWTDKPISVNQWGVMALSVYSLSSNNIDRRGVIETDNPTGSFSYANRAYALSYGLKLNDDLAVGATAKYVDATLAEARAGALTADIGVLRHYGQDLSFGAGIRNSFGKLALGNGSDPLPLINYVGLGYHPYRAGLVVAEINQEQFSDTNIALGFEHVQKIARDLVVSARAGFRSDRKDLGFMAGTSWGFGINWKDLSAEMSWSPGGVLGDVFHYTMSIRFERANP